MKKEFDELTEAGCRRWVITNFIELKEHVLTQCKGTKNLEKRLDKMLTRITSLEENINDLMGLKNTAQELHEAYKSFNSQMDQAEERMSEIEDQLNEIKCKGKIRKKRVREDSRWRCENNTGLELSLNLQRGESELHFQTDLCCPQTGNSPSIKET